MAHSARPLVPSPLTVASSRLSCPPARAGRYVCGLREVLRSLKTNKAKALIVAHNIEKIESEAGLDQIIAELVQLCDMKLEWVYDEDTKRSSQQLVERDGHVPIVFAFTRRHLSRCLKRSAKTSCVAVLSHDGASDLFHVAMRVADAARKQYEALTNAHTVDRERSRALLVRQPKGAPKAIAYDELTLHALEGQWVLEE